MRKKYLEKLSTLAETKDKFSTLKAIYNDIDKLYEEDIELEDIVISFQALLESNSIETNPLETLDICTALRKKYARKTVRHKLLISPGYGAGWSTWSYKGEKERDFLLKYQPFIDYLEEHQEMPAIKSIEGQELMSQITKDFQDKFGIDEEIYDGGFEQLTVVEVSGDYVVNVYDGAESVTEL